MNSETNVKPRLYDSFFVQQSLNGSIGMNIIKTAISDGRFKMFVAVTRAAELDEMLSDQGPYTLFAPTDEAFMALPEEKIELLLGNVSILTNMCLNHITHGSKSATDITGNKSVKTASGGKLMINFDGCNLALNESNIIETDIAASNGLIHVIDALLIPEPKPV